MLDIFWIVLSLSEIDHKYNEQLNLIISLYPCNLKDICKKFTKNLELTLFEVQNKNSFHMAALGDLMQSWYTQDKTSYIFAKIDALPLLWIIVNC